MVSQTSSFLILVCHVTGILYNVRCKCTTKNHPFSKQYNAESLRYVINEVNAAIGTPEYPSLVSKFLQLAEPLNGTYIQRVKTLARSLQVHIVLGFLQKNGTTDQVHNAAALFDVQGNIALIYHKVHFAQGYTINPPCYAPGSDFPVAKTTFGTTGIMICFDRQLPETARNLRLAGAQLLVNPSYGSFSRANSSGQDGWNTRLLQTRAYENGVPLIFTNPGQSLILDDHGEFVAVGTANETVYADIMISSEDFSALPPATLQYRRPPLYTSLVHGTDPAIVPGERCGTP